MVNRNGGMMMKAREKQPGDARPGWRGSAFYALAAMAFLAISCSRHPDAETRDIPESIRVTADLGRPEDGLYLLINTLFVSVPENWFCVQHGGGGGPLPIFRQKQYLIIRATDTANISLQWEEKTFCPYILNGILISLRSGLGDYNNLVTLQINADKNSFRKTLPDEIQLKVKQEYPEGKTTCFFPNTIEDTNFDLPKKVKQIQTHISIIQARGNEEDR